jgi:hypothetical protein
VNHPGHYGPVPSEPYADPNAAPSDDDYAGEYEVYVPDTPTDPGTFTYQPAAQHRPDQPWRYDPSTDAAHTDAPKHHNPHTRKLWWGIGGLGVVALIITLLVATGVFDATVDEPGSNPQATGEYAPPSAGGNHALRVIDKDSGISYDYLGEGWKDYSMGTMVENQNTVGEYIITQPTVPGGGQFIAQVTSGLLSPEFGAPGPATFASTLAAVETSVFGNYYPLPNTPTNQSEGELQIDGHAAYRRSTDLTWDVEGYDSTGERVVLLLIDTGKSAPVFFYCSFPNTHAELYPLIDQVIASIKVDQ